ncbi:MAG: Fe(3+) dicitrate transport protein [Parvicellaceae bacterium]|jgi:Fe(3+) dicitrate transport protein
MKYCGVVVLLLLSISAYAGTLKAKVVSSNGGANMQSVSVSIGDLINTYSDEEGNIFIENVKSGVYHVSITTLGYAKVVIAEVEFNDGITDIGTVEMSPLFTLMDPFEIVYIRPGYSSHYQGTSNVISQMELRKVQPLGSEEILKKVVGVNVAGDMGISNRLNIGIRGSYPRRSEKVLLLEDGIPIAPAPYLSPSAYYNPPADRLDGIEIIKGADVLTMGPNNMYGVINYITKRPSLKPELGVSLVGGQRGYQSQFVTLGGTRNNVGAELQILNKSFNGFQNNTSSKIFNTTGKVYADLGSKSTLYAKFNFHQEESQATYSGQTPLTFALDPIQNPFDSDDLSTKRYALDLIYKYSLNEKTMFTTTVYASQFSRDWWRQNTTLLAASDVRTYLGEDIFNSRYSYLTDQTFSGDDYVRVGRLSNGRESTKARNRVFRVAGVKEDFKWKYDLSSDFKGQLTVGLNVHTEQFFNQEITGDSSRFARSGNLIKDEKFSMTAMSGYVKNQFTYKKFSFSPMLRYELIEMRKFNLLSISNDPLNDGSKHYGSTLNKFSQLLPGISIQQVLVDTNLNKLEIFGGYYQGFTPPTSSVGFVGVDEEGIVNTSPAIDEVNIKSETSNSFEVGTRGYAFQGKLSGQVTSFYNVIQNYYAAGRKEAFETLGSVDIKGLEVSANFDLAHLLKLEEHKIVVGVALTMMKSTILDGKLKDSDMFKANHTTDSKNELIDKINTERGGFNVFFAGDSLISRDLVYADFGSIESVEYEFGEGKIADNRAPYTPSQIITGSLSYAYKGFSIGASYSVVGAQYSEYLNFENETAEGAIGKLDAYSVIDANIGYRIKSKKKLLSNMSIFVVGKNLTNKVYKASRLHRVSSGIMPGGFRQINAGIKFTL